MFALVLSHIVRIDFICTALFIDNKIVDEYTLECLGERLATDTDILLILLAKQKTCILYTTFFPDYEMLWRMGVVNA